MKGQFLDNRIRLNLAGFYYDYKDKIEGVLTIDPVTMVGIGSLTNAAAASVKGVEVEAQAFLSDALLVDLAVGYQDAQYDKFLTADPSNQALGNQDLSGNQLSMAPKWTVHIGAQRDWDLGHKLGSLSVRVDFSWVDEQFFRSFNLSTDKSGSYHKTNARLSWESTDKHLSASVYVRNLENKDVLSNLSVTDPTTGFQRVGTYQPPRTYGTTLSYKY